jgi:uncharacterized LabA/DUF88 family protein
MNISTFWGMLVAVISIWNMRMGKKLAILIDGENVAAKWMTSIRTHVTTLGEPTIWRVFADFSNNSHKEWLDVCRNEWLEPVLRLSGGAGRNSTDIAIVVEAMDILHREPPEGMVIVSNDSDFAPLAERIRASGVKVYGIGTKLAQDRLIESFTNFVCLDPKAIVASKALSDEDQLYRVVDKLSHQASIALTEIGQHLKKHHPDLGQQFGKGRLKKTLKEAERYLIEDQIVSRKRA